MNSLMLFISTYKYLLLNSEILGWLGHLICNQERKILNLNDMQVSFINLSYNLISI